MTAAQTAAALAATCQNSRGPIESMTGQSAGELFRLRTAMPKGGAPVEKKK